MREDILIERVRMLTEKYTFDQPFSIYLRDHFRKHPEMGSNDRRLTREWCFNFFRIGLNSRNIAYADALSAACFLCSTSINRELTYLFNKNCGFNAEDISQPLEAKINQVKKKLESFTLENIFPSHELLSDQINKTEWYLSFLRKPLTWIRIRRKFLSKVLNELDEKKISYNRSDNPLMLSFPADTGLDKTDSFKKGYFEIQDRSSQLTGDFFRPNQDELWWDACAGSGGKSLLLKEKNESIRIFATDTRQNILTRYAERMKKAGYNSFRTQTIDLISHKDNSLNGKLTEKQNFDGIIADVPCSGSGTWSRSPEWNQIDIGPRIKDHFVPMQRQIISNIVSTLKKDHPLIYITCSVFRSENEENADYFLNNLPLKLEKSSYLDGYQLKSDTLFIARFIRK